MRTILKGKHFITTEEWDRQELDTVFETAFDLKKRFAYGEPHRLLPDKTLFFQIGGKQVHQLMGCMGHMSFDGTQRAVQYLGYLLHR